MSEKTEKLTPRDKLLRELNRLSAMNSRETDQTAADQQEARIADLNRLLEGSMIPERTLT